jgi:hypothetical protein
MIKILKEYEDLGDYENCIFCDQPTEYWHLKSNRPICKSCASENGEEDIETAKYNY